jgi:hypothetical protein
VGARTVEEDDGYDGNLRSSAADTAFLHGLSDLPSLEEWGRLSLAPEPDEFQNPPGCRSSHRVLASGATRTVRGCSYYGTVHPGRTEGWMRKIFSVRSLLDL